MSISSVDEPNPEAERRLRGLLNTMRDPIFAVLDGGHFDDLEDELADLGIRSRSLFLSGGDEAMRRDGPWLVALADRTAREHVVALAVEKPCAVFWSCPKGEYALWRHLRTINKILVPDDRIAGNDGRLGRPVRYERVLFRHWDPNVLGSFLPLLNAEQFARVFGPATAIFMNAADYGGLKHAPRPEDLPVAPKGLLTIGLEEIAEASKAMTQLSRRRILIFLRTSAAEQTSEMDDRDLMDRIQRYERQADDFGISHERARARFSWLMIASGDKFIQQPGVAEFLKKAPGDPNKRLHLLSEAMAEAALQGKK